MKKEDWIISPSPFIMTRPTVSTMSLLVAATLVPHLIMLGATGDIIALRNIALCMAGSVLAELIHLSYDKKAALADGTVLLSGLITGFFIPVTFPFAAIPVIAFVSTVFAKVIFGGTGCNWINPAALAVCIAYISHPDAFPAYLVSADTVTTVGDMLGALKLEQFNLLTGDSETTSFLNKILTAGAGIKLPEGYITLFWNSPSTIPAFRYNACTLIASVLLFSFRLTDWILPSAYLLVYGVSVRLFAMMPFTNAPFSGDIFFAFLTSGTLFAAFYLLPDTATAPRSIAGKAITGGIAGIASFLICGPGGSPAGTVFAVMIANAVSPIIELEETNRRKLTGVKR